MPDEARDDVWHGVLMADLHYNEQMVCVKRFDILPRVQYWLQKLGAVENPFYESMIKVLGSDVTGALRFTHEARITWATAHLADLIARSDQPVTGVTLEHHGCELAEFYMLQFASEIQACQGTWQIAASYLHRQPQSGKRALEQLLDRQAPESDRITHSLQAACRRYGVPEQVRQAICTARGMRCMRLGKLGSAVTWLTGTADASRLESIVNDIVVTLTQSLSFVVTMAPGPLGQPGLVNTFGDTVVPVGYNPKAIKAALQELDPVANSVDPYEPDRHLDFLLMFRDLLLCLQMLEVERQHILELVDQNSFVCDSEQTRPVDDILRARKFAGSLLFDCLENASCKFWMTLLELAVPLLLPVSNPASGVACGTSQFAM